MMAMPVPVTSVVKKTLPIYLDYPGRVESIRNIALEARVSGYIDAQPAADGADVRTGDLLYKIDPRDLQAALDQANAQAERDKASLEYADANFSRGEELVKSGFVTKDAYDQRASAMHQAEAALALDRAAIEAAKLNLGYTEIRAPFAGRLGRNQAAKGALVGPASGPLNTLVQLDPIYVSFNPSESDLAEIAEARAAGRVEAEISVAREADPPRKGELTFLDNVVDRATGTIAARVTIANPDFALAARPICPRAAAHQGRARRSHGAPGGARLESDGQIRLCRRRGRQGRVAAGLARPRRRRARQHRQGPNARRPHHRRQPAKDRPRLPRAAPARERASQAVRACAGGCGEVRAAKLSPAYDDVLLSYQDDSPARTILT